MNDENISFMDGGDQSVEGALGVSLLRFEESIGSHLSWEGGAEVLLGTVSMSTLSGLGMVEFRVLDRDIVPIAVKQDFMTGFPIMATELVQQFLDRDEELVTGLVEEIGPGFLGWVVITQGWDAEEKAQDGEPMPIRMTAYYNMGFNAYWVARRTINGDVQDGWGTPDDSSATGNIYFGLKKMTEVSHYVRIGRDLLGQ